MKTKPCEYCHRLPLHAGGCNVLCFRGGWIGRIFLSMEAMRIGTKLLNEKNANKK